MRKTSNKQGRSRQPTWRRFPLAVGNELKSTSAGGTTVPMARKKKSLLIVDDEVNVTRTLQMVFEDEGYTVTPAYSCAEALKIMKNGHNFDGVITDLNMERDDIGLIVARRALELKPQPVVAIC